MQYRRSQQTGGCFFFTVVTFNRRPILTLEHNIQRLRQAFRREIKKRPFGIDSIVVLPDHFHAIFQLPNGDSHYSQRLSSIKRYFSIGCIGEAKNIPESRGKKREKGVWQRRFWEHKIRDENDWRKHMDYIHFNPVKHGYAKAAKEWPYSSFNKCVEKGWYSDDWGSSEPENIHQMNLE